MPIISLKWFANRGRNGWDVPSQLLDGQVAEAYNVTLERGTLGRKRDGAVAVTIGGDAFSGIVQLLKFVPGQNDAAAELFIISNDGTTKILRVAAGTAAANLTLKDAVQTTPQECYGAVLNGKLYLAYNSAVNRLHVFDPSISSTIVRRVDLATPAAPTVANGGGAGVAVLRYYRVQWVTITGSTVTRKSLLGTAVSFTPGANGVTVTQPTLPAEGETHWLVFGSADNTSFFQVSTSAIAVGTTTYLDNAAPSTYPTLTAAPEEGAYTPWPSVKYLLSDGERLLGFGVYETAAGDSHIPKDGRVYFSPVLDTTAVGYGDDERVSNSITFKGWIDVARNSGAEDRTICGPIDGQIFVGQSRGLYLLIPTGQATAPYRRVVLSDSLGCVSHASTFMGEDEAGRACIYFLDPERGPYRYGANGLEWLGYDVQDIWATFNPAATFRTAMGVYQRAERKVLWLIATGSSNDATTPIWFHVHEGQRERSHGVRFGWTTGSVTGTPKALVMFASSIAATMSRKLKPYLGYLTGSVLIRFDDAADTDDAGTAFQSYVDSPVFDGDQPRLQKTITRGDSWLAAKAGSQVIIQITVTRNYGDSARTFLADLTPLTVAQTRVRVKIGDLATADMVSCQLRVGDPSALSVAWTIDGLELLIDISQANAGSTGR